jgi:secreted effector protein SseB
MNSITAVRSQDPAPQSCGIALESAAADPQGPPDQVFGPGLGILRLYMRMLNQLASEQHQRMKQEGESGNEAQSIVSKIDAYIAGIDAQGGGADKKATVDEDDPIVKFIEEHQGLDAKGFLNYKDENGKRVHSKETLVALRSNVQKYATQHSDASSQVQLQVQKTMQTYNVTVGLMNSLQTMLGDMTKQFAQAMR